MNNNAVNNNRIDLVELISVCIDAGIRSGAIIQSVWESGDLKIQNKGKSYDPFTAADTEAQQLIIGMLHKKWPKLNIIGEEDCEIPETDVDPNLRYQIDVPEKFRDININDLCIFVDPLDGTKEFASGNLEAVLTLIGISYQGKPIAGIMHRPYSPDPKASDTESSQIPLGTTFCGVIGVGAFSFSLDRDNLFEPIEPIQRDPERFIICTSRSHATDILNTTILGLNPTETIRVGGAGHKAVLLIEGVADMYLFPVIGTKLWDTCAPEAIIKSLGGYFTDSYGNDIEYFYDSSVMNVNGFVASFSKELNKKTLYVIDKLRL